MHQPAEGSISKRRLLPGIRQTFQRVQADALQHPIPPTPLWSLLHDDQGLCHQRGQPVDHGQRGTVAADEGRSIERPSVGEHGEPSQQDLLLVAEEIMAPVHGRLEGLLALAGAARSTGEQPEPVIEHAGDLFR